MKDIDGASLAPAELAKLKKLDPKKLPLVKGKPRLGSCVATPPKFVAIGLELHRSREGNGLADPRAPDRVLQEPRRASSGPTTTSCMPKDSRPRTGRSSSASSSAARRATSTKKDALKYVAGYCLINDVSERDFQSKHGASQWGKGKGCDTFGPIGPWMVTPDEIKDVQNLDMWLDVNGERRQRGNTKTMIFGVAEAGGGHLALHDAVAGRRHHDRHAAGRGAGDEADSAVFEGRRRRDAGHQGAWASSGKKSSRSSPNARHCGDDPWEFRRPCPALRSHC